MIRQFSSPKRRNKQGASSVEYGLLVALIVAVIVVAFFALDNLFNNSFAGTCSQIKSEGTITTTCPADR
ncbi:MAG TPA: Flp family type IVb pilin [Nocardioidaceae bacterium]